MYKKMNRTDSVDLKFSTTFILFIFLYDAFQCQQALLKKRYKVSMRSKVRGFDGTLPRSVASSDERHSFGEKK